MSDSFLSSVESSLKSTSEDNPWYKTKEGWAEYYDELKRSIPEDAGDILGMLSDPEGVIRATASFSANEMRSLRDLGPKGYAQRVAETGADFARQIKEDPEASADISSSAVLALATKKLPKLPEAPKPPTPAYILAPDPTPTPTPKGNLVGGVAKKGADVVGDASKKGAALALTLNDVGQREEPRLLEMLRRDSAESQIDAVGEDRLTAPVSRFLRGSDAFIQRNVGEPVLEKLVNLPLFAGSDLVQDQYEELVDSRISNEILSRLNTEKEKPKDRDKLKEIGKKYFPSAPIRNLSRR